MQIEKAIELRRRWIAKGDPPCDHPHLDKEYDLGADTGDYVCTTCGKAGWDSDWPQREREEEKSKASDSK
jgi:hypothetical protein